MVKKCILPLDKFIIYWAKTGFFKTLASETTVFFKGYQTDSLLIPFPYTDLIIILKSVIQHSIIKDILNNKLTTSIDIFDKKKLLIISSKQIDFGYLTR